MFIKLAIVGFIYFAFYKQPLLKTIKLTLTFEFAAVGKVHLNSHSGNLGDKVYLNL